MNKLLHSRKIKVAVAVLAGVIIYFALMLLENGLSLKLPFGENHLVLAGIVGTILVYLSEEIFYSYW